MAPQGSQTCPQEQARMPSPQAWMPIPQAQKRSLLDVKAEALRPPLCAPLTLKELVSMKDSDQNCRMPSLVTVRKCPIFLSRWTKNSTFTISHP